MGEVSATTTPSVTLGSVTYYLQTVCNADAKQMQTQKLGRMAKRPYICSEISRLGD